MASASPYWRRIQRALDHVAQHLEEPIHLQDLAKAAAFSEHHFHRIFRAVMDETVGEYITRQRLQTAALMLAYHHDLSVTTIGLACGYSSPSNFSKAFYKFFGVSPSEVRNPTGKPPAAISTLKRRYGHDFSPADLHRIPDPTSTGGHPPQHDLNVRLETWASFPVVSMVSEQGYDVEANLALWAELIRRTRALGLCGEDVDSYAVVYDDPALTSEERCRYQACIRLTAEAKDLAEPLFAWRVPAGRYAVFAYSGPAHEVTKVYREIYARWFPHSSLAPDTLPPIEHYIQGEPDAQGNIDMEVAIKVRRIRG